MHIYFSGIGGVGLGPLALIAKQAGHTVSGSDRERGLMTDQLEAQGISPHIGQTGEEIAKLHTTHPIDHVVYTAGLPDTHPELVFARAHNIRTTKRHELLNLIISEKNLKLIGISGTHGKTTTTGMVIWLLQQLGVPLSYSIGTNISFGPAGKYEQGSEYFVYEADEFDRNMLQFHPYLALLPAVTYDHPDVYDSPEDYQQAFRQFVKQSNHTVLWQHIADYLGLQSSPNLTILGPDAPKNQIKLAGEHIRANAWLAVQAVLRLQPQADVDRLIAIINDFPGTQRRFEKLAPNLYTDYAHHPHEIAAMIQLAGELSKNIVAVYQPHQNVRQHEIQKSYGDCFKGVAKVYWLPTYLSRENPDLPILEPAQLIANLPDPSIAEPADFNDELVQKIRQARKDGALILCMSAGALDQWVRDHIEDL